MLYITIDGLRTSTKMRVFIFLNNNDCWFNTS